MKLWKLAPILLAGAAAAVACTKGPDESSSDTAAAVSRKTIDGAYMKIYGGKQSYFVFHTATGNEKKNTFFAEFDNDGQTVRADGIFTYGHDNLGNYVDLRRNDGSQSDFSTSDPADASSPPADDAGDPGAQDASSDDAGAPDPSADAGSPTSASNDELTAPIYQRYHFVKTGKNETILTRDARDRTYQFKIVSSYCGEGGAKDCVMLKGADACSTKWTCTPKHTCACGY